LKRKSPSRGKPKKKRYTDRTGGGTRICGATASVGEKKLGKKTKRDPGGLKHKKGGASYNSLCR